MRERAASISSAGTPNPSGSSLRFVTAPSLTVMPLTAPAFAPPVAAPDSETLTDCRTTSPAFKVYGHGSASGRT